MIRCKKDGRGTGQEDLKLSDFGKSDGLLYNTKIETIVLGGWFIA